MNTEQFKECQKKYPRTQKVQANAIGKMVRMLRYVRDNSPTIREVDVTREFKVSRTSFMACKALGYLGGRSYRYSWLVGEPTPQMAINVIEYCRVYNIYRDGLNRGEKKHDYAQKQIEPTTKKQVDLIKVDVTPNMAKSDDLVIYKKVKKNIKLPFGFILTREVLELVK